MRCFIALEIPPQAREKLAELSQNTRALGLRATFTSPEQWHFTLAFLGEVPDAEVPARVEAFRKALAGRGALELKLKGAGFFPGERRINVFWVGLEGVGLAELQKAVAEAVGEGDERESHPHITICRVKGVENLVALRALQKENAEKEFASFKADRIVFKKSVLTPGGAVHEEIASVALA